MKIKITVPQKEGDKWMLGYGARPRSMARADTLYNRLERFLLRTKFKEKMAIVVKYGRDSSGKIINESLLSFDAHYLLYTLACFLEDFLPKQTLKRAERSYCI